MPLGAVLFDLDGTLLQIELDAFLRRYFMALERVAARHFPGTEILPAIMAATKAMQQLHPGLTNRAVFHADFMESTGIDLEAEWEVFERFYAEEYMLLGEGAAPAKGASRAVLTAQEAGLAVVVATQPIFPRTAIETRLAWAGLSDSGLEVLTTYESMHACKPHLDYFREAAAMAGCRPSECLMVGDDRYLDMAAADAGLLTFYTGSDPSTPADWRGDLDALADLLPRIGPSGES